MNFVLPTLIWQESLGWCITQKGLVCGHARESRLDCGLMPIVGSTMVRQMFLDYIGNLAKKELVSKPERLPASSISLHGLFCGSMPWVSAMISLSDGLWHRCVRQINDFLHYFPLVRIFCHSIRKVNKNNGQAVADVDPDLEQWHVALVRTQRGRTSQPSLLIIQMGTVTQEDMLTVPHKT